MEVNLTVLYQIRMMLRRFGLDVNRYTPAHSEDARLCRFLKIQGVDLVADVGANDGGYVRGLRGAGFKGEVISFEPLEDAHSRLRDAAVGAVGWHVMPRMALGDHDHTILPMQKLHSDAAPASNYIGSIFVDVKRLDNLDESRLTNAKAIHLKVDTQGYEMPVLLGSVGLLPRVCSLQLELSLVSLYSGQTLYRDIIDWVGNQGYDLVGVIPGFVDQRSGRMLQIDGLFARRSVG
jgi:FkbM family methyltransferase